MYNATYTYIHWYPKVAPLDMFTISLHKLICTLPPVPSTTFSSLQRVCYCIEIFRCSTVYVCTVRTLLRSITCMHVCVNAYINIHTCMPLFELTNIITLDYHRWLPDYLRQFMIFYAGREKLIPYLEWFSDHRKQIAYICSYQGPRRPPRDMHRAHSGRQLPVNI